ncbi:MAG: DUF839 domain-containing protein [Cyclobacteriaceae bacterium]|nr:DUF839 domain-containing protein [Cyclobacteriaceae bacterium]
MKNDINHRRVFLKHAGIVSLGFIGLSRCTPGSKDALEEKNTAKETVKRVGFGPLIPDPNKYLDLPQGFTYKIISTKGDEMDDGFLVPAAADAMGTFHYSEDRLIIVRNHENSPGAPQAGAFGNNYELLEKLDRKNFYDAGSLEKPCLGGTTTMVYNETTQEVELCYLSLAGTVRNCAGGVTPWGSWITCEEDVTVSDGILEKDHGFNFEVPASDKIMIADPIPLTAMGRFNHEAVCVDPATSIVYQTEDRGDSLIYRFIPHEKEKLHKGGRLQALVIKGQAGFDTRNWEIPAMQKDLEMEAEWIDMDDVLSPLDDLRHRGHARGAALFARGEGMWFGKDELFFACTNGGPNRFGQVFKYIPSPHEGTAREGEVPGKLVLFAESHDDSLLKMCDNLTISPWGDVVLCEDNSVKNHIRGITPEGAVYTLGANVGSTSEFAGAVFSPSGKTLFVNIQGSGETLAITGPWG